MSKPTKDDASLFLQFMAVMAADEKNSIANHWIFEKFDEKNYDDFKAKYPLGSEGYRNFTRFARNGELLGTLVNKELLNEDLVFDLYGSMLWEKIEAIVYGMRKDLEMPRLYENFEVFAKRYPMWAENNPPKV